MKMEKFQIGDHSMEEVSLYNNNGGMQKRTKWIIAGAVTGGALVVIVVLVAIYFTVIAGKPPTDPNERAIWLMKKNLLLDGHNNFPYRLRTTYNGNLTNLNLNRTQFNTDWFRARQGFLSGQFWSLYVPCGSEADKVAVRDTLEQIDLVNRMIETNPDVLQLVTSSDQFKSAFSQYKIASLMGIEGGHAIDSSLEVLRMFYDLGVRSMSLTHNCNTPWAESSSNSTIYPDVKGLTPFGVSVVKEMNRLGMLVDLSHASVKTMNDTLDAVSAPVIFSHSNAKAVNDHPRNVPDDILVRLKDNGGIVMVNFYPPYLCPDVYSQQQQIAQLNLTESDQMRQLIQWYYANPDSCTIDHMIKHIDHIIDVAGPDHVGIGANFDDFPFYVTGLEDVSSYPTLITEMIKQGHNDVYLSKMMGQNIKRVLDEAEEYAEKANKQSKKN